MNKTQHTKGPWNIDKIGGGQKGLYIYGETGWVADVSENNARLIASAPELLEALKRHQADGECYCVNKGEGNTAGNPCGWCIGNEAIAKATKGE